MSNESSLTSIAFPWITPAEPDPIPVSVGDSLEDFMPAWADMLAASPPDVSKLMPSEATIQGLVGTDLSAVDAGVEATLDNLFDSGAIERGTPQEAAARTLLGIKSIQAKLASVVGLRKQFFDALLGAMSAGVSATVRAQQNEVERVARQNSIYDNRASTASRLTNTKASLYFQEQNLRMNRAKTKHEITNDEWRLILTERAQDLDATIQRANAQNMLGSSATLVTIASSGLPTKPTGFGVPKDDDIYGETMPDLPDLLDTTTS